MAKGLGSAEMTASHASRGAYDGQLQVLSNTLVRLGGLAEAQIAGAMQSLVKRDSALACRIVEADRKVDAVEADVQAQAVRLLALRQPVAVDLRHVVGALKIASDLERVADYATNVAKRVLVLNQTEPLKPVAAVPYMARLVQGLITDVLDAYVEWDVEKARSVWRRDERVDDMYNSLFREAVTYMMEDARNITPCTHLLFIAKNIERIGDHATNIAETVYYLISGQVLRGVRPKGDVWAEYAPILPKVEES